MTTTVELTMTGRTTAAIREVLSGKRRGVPAAMLFAGPAMIVSIAYMDPGNFATNIQAGAKYGYTLLWVVLMANLVAMLFQALSAKLGIVTGRNLAEMCREQFPAPAVIAMWIVSEVAAMATDLAEFLGGAIGLSICSNMPLLVGMVITGDRDVRHFIFERHGYRPMELIIGALVAVIGLCYLVEMFIAPVDWGSAGLHSVLPQIPDASALTHIGRHHRRDCDAARHLSSRRPHPDRAPARDDDERRKLLRFSNTEVVIALAIAGLDQYGHGDNGLQRLPRRPQRRRGDRDGLHTLTPLLGIGAAGVFLVSLLASGVSSSVVGTMAGQLIMQGFVGFRIPIWVRRLVTMVPAFIVVALGVNSTERPRDQPGGAQPRAAGADDRARNVHSARRHHGRLRQQ